MITITKIGEHHMDGGLYQDEKGRCYCDNFNTLKEDGTIEVYELSPNNEPDGEPNIRVQAFLSNPQSEREKREALYRHDYMMLDRMRMDCEYYQSADAFNRAHCSTIEDTIKQMEELWNKFPADLKPQWVSLEQIGAYKTKFNIK